MLRDRYAPQDLFAPVPEAALAFDPVLARLDLLLDDDDLYQCGRPSTLVEVILRLLLVRRLYGWSYAEVERFVSDSHVLRQFCRAYLRPVLDATTLIRWAALVGPDTVAALDGRVLARVQATRVTRGRKPRTDGTVVETTVRHSTDSKTLGDGAANLPAQAFHTITRSVCRLA